MKIKSIYSTGLDNDGYIDAIKIITYDNKEYTLRYCKVDGDNCCYDDFDDEHDFKIMIEYKFSE